MINLLIVEDQQTILQLLKNYLEQESDLRIVAIAADGQVAIDKVDKFRPDVVLMDVEMPGVDGISATKIISERYPEVKVLILSTHDDDQIFNLALQAGAKGYILKTTPAPELIKFIRSVHRGRLQVGSGMVQKLPTEYNPVISRDNFNGQQRPDLFSTQKPASRTPYYLLGVLLNFLVWLVVVVYWKIAPPQYTSEWGLKVLGRGTGVELSLPSIGRASSNSKSEQSGEDIRVDYAYIAADSSILERAAIEAGLSAKDFGKPEIITDEEGSIITLMIEGDTPIKAQQKAYAFNHVLTEKIDKLRQAEVERQEQHTQKTLEKARQRLDSAQEKLSSYQVSSSLSSEEQIKQITNNLEDLYRQRAELTAQEKGLNNLSQQLGEELNLSSTEATAAYKLLDDDVFQQQLELYAQGRGELNNLLSRFTAVNPAVIEKQSELEETTTSLQERAAFLLNRSVSKQELERIIYLTLDPKVKTVRQEVFKDLISNAAEEQKLEAQIQELENQMGRLESRQRNIAQNKLKMDRFQRDLQVAEAVFATTLAELDLGKEHVYSLYPPLQLIKEPSLPKENQPTSPNLRLLLLGGMAGSFLVTTGLILLWFERQPASLSTPNLSKNPPVHRIDRAQVNSSSRKHRSLNSKTDKY
ncbi:response regulator [Pleurocapsa sp. PCC 7319]|uniref:response regulator n=1 Tax=Pleurocapsa sp. PCC 7319 TaxID=118161 RepID=UPI000348EF82|nr:response regulator [Pleurocapsa sp. PCC 7319]